MPGLIIWKDQEINKLRRDIDGLFDRLLDDFGLHLSLRPARQVPFIDLSETEDALIIRAEIPGIDPEDLDISITEYNLTIKGEMKQEHVEGGVDYHRTERRYGYFSRTLQLPCPIMTEGVKAEYKKGVLNIVMPKYKPDRPRQVKIRLK